jgi:hypothetical protein
MMRYLALGLSFGVVASVDARACEIEVINDSSVGFAVIVHLPSSFDIVGPNLATALPPELPVEIDISDSAVNTCRIPLIFEVLEKHGLHWKKTGQIPKDPLPKQDDIPRFLITDLDLSSM